MGLSAHGAKSKIY